MENNNELIAVTKQRNELENKLEKSKSYKNVMKRDNAGLRKQLTAVTEQRDDLLRYNEAYRQDALICANCDAISIKEYKEAIEQRDEARRLAEKYRNLSCESQDEADETLLPWENNQPTKP